MNDDPDIPKQSRIAHRTAQLSGASRLLHRIDHVVSMPIAAVVVAILVAGSVGVGMSLGFPTMWFNVVEVAATVITLMMVFAIQHTQSRDQVATQRKLDELIRVIPGASEQLMMLEEAPSDVMRAVEEGHRDSKAETMEEDDVDTLPSWDDLQKTAMGLTGDAVPR